MEALAFNELSTLLKINKKFETFLCILSQTSKSWLHPELKVVQLLETSSGYHYWKRHSIEPDFRLSEGLNPTCGLLKMWDGQNLQ